MNIKMVYMLTILLPGMIAGQGASADTPAHADHTPRAEQRAPGSFAAANASMMQAMHSLEPTGDVDYDFMRGMIPHHQGAIDMAKVMLDQGGDEQMLALARAILVAQGTEIAQMQAWLHEHGQPRPGDNAQDVIAAWKRIDQRMMNEVQAASAGAIGAGDDITGDFVRGMIPHHVAAVDMAYVLLGHSAHSDLRTMAKAVIREQEREIRELRAWQDKAGDQARDAHSH